MPQSSDEEETDQHLAQFCNACQTQKGCHHHLCPHNSTFATSGAAEKLEIILAGVEIGCPKCKKEYTAGTITTHLSHHKKCQRRGKRGRPKRKYAEVTQESQTQGCSLQLSKIPIFSSKVRAFNKATQQSQVSVIFSSKVRAFNTASQLSQVSVPQSSDEEETDQYLVQFCNACQTLKGNHHRLCYHHPTFESSGAKQKLELLMAGVEVGCASCQNEYSTGRIGMAMRHDKKCERRGKPGPPKRKYTEATQESQTQGSPQLSRRPISSSKVRAFNTASQLSQVSVPQSSDEEETDQYLVQFCNACQTLKGNHHRLCYHHPTFESSGAKQKLELLMAGVEVGCASCQKEYSTGRNAPTERHDQKCKRRGKGGRPKRKYAEATQESQAPVVGANKERAPNMQSPTQDTAASQVAESQIQPSMQTTTERRRDGTQAGCNACIFEEEQNRKPTHLVHDDWCVRSSAFRKREREICQQSSTKRHKSDPDSQEVSISSRASVDREDSIISQPCNASVNSDSVATSKASLSGLAVGSVTPDTTKTGQPHKTPVIEHPTAENGGEEPSEKEEEPQKELVTVSIATRKENATALGKLTLLENNKQTNSKVQGCDKNADGESKGQPSQKELVAVSIATRKVNATQFGKSALQEDNKQTNVQGCDKTDGEPKDQPSDHHRETKRLKRETKEKFLDDSVSIDDVSVPFCRACKDPSNVHHSLCPQHPQFHNSGALEKLEKIRRGVSSDCPACTVQYERGSLGKLNVNHSVQCQRLETERRKKTEEEVIEREEATEKQSSSEIRTKTGRRAKTSEKSLAANLEDFGSSVNTRKNTRQCPKAKIVTPNERDFENDGQKIRLGSQVNVIKPTWTSCENPWGAMGYHQGDVVVSGDGGFTHHEVLLPGKRFARDPFGVESGYNETHFSPSEGTHVLKLKRDALADTPWGFSIEHHDFGSACLVQAIDPNSPASNAKYVGSSACSPICVHDMIITVNGKDVGGMTEVGLELEMETSGVEMILVVSRYRFPSLVDRLKADLENDTWATLDRNLQDKRNLGWSELDLSSKDKCINDGPLQRMEESGQSQDSAAILDDLPPDDMLAHFQENLSMYQETEQGAICIESFQEKFSMPLETEHGPMSSEPREEIDADDTSNAASLKSDDWDNDDNPWVGCVCGEIHASPAVVFWIQCEACDTWCNVAPACVGFDEDEAKFKDKWTCRACPSDYTSP